MEKSDSWEGSPTLSNLDMDHFRIRKRKHMQTNAKKGRFFNICALQLCMVYLPFMLNQLRSLGVPLSLSHINTHLIIRHYTHKKKLCIHIWASFGIIGSIPSRNASRCFTECWFVQGALTRLGAGTDLLRGNAWLTSAEGLS